VYSYILHKDQVKYCTIAMRPKLVVLILTLVVKHSNASSAESTCSFSDSRGSTKWCWGLLKNVQCSAPTFDDDRKCKNKNETIALFDELLLEENMKNGGYLYKKRRIMRMKRLVINKFKDNPSTTCLTRKEYTNKGLESLERCFTHITGTQVANSLCECKYVVPECNREVYGFANTMCLYRDKDGAQPACGEVLKRGLSEEEKSEILDLHNELRAQVASGKETRGVNGSQPSASNMRKLEWNDDLAAVAQRLVDQCLHKVENKYWKENRLVKPWIGPANNIANTVGQNKGYDVHLENMTTSDFLNHIIEENWYDKVQNLSPVAVDSWSTLTVNGTIIADKDTYLLLGSKKYAQLVWANTEAVGCGYMTTRNVTFKEDIKKLESMENPEEYVESVLICNYGPTGNAFRVTKEGNEARVTFEPIYKQGEPGSDCPQGTEALDSGLCEKKSRK